MNTVPAHSVAEAAPVPPASPALEAALARTRRITYGHYENFPVASWLVPRTLRQHVCNIYAFARTADDFADEARFAGTRTEHLQRWRRHLLDAAQRAHGLSVAAPEPFADITEAEIFTALEWSLAQRQLPVALLDDLLTAYLIDCTKRRYQSFGEVLHYCRHSANPVGRLILHLFGYGNEQWLTWSDAICTALQLANFWQDLAVDLQKDRIYLPQDEMRAAGVTDEDLFAHRDSPAVRALLRQQVERTEQLFAQGRALCTTVPHRRLRLELKLTWLGGMRILERIRANGYVPYCRPTLRRSDWLRLLWRTWRW